MNVAFLLIHVSVFLPIEQLSTVPEKIQCVTQRLFPVYQTLKAWHRSELRTRVLSNPPSLQEIYKSTIDQV